MKKVLSCMLALVLLLASAPGAFAASANPFRYADVGDIVLFGSYGYASSLAISPYYASLNNCSYVPFYYASATSELKEGDILFTAAYAIDETVNRPWVEGVRGAGNGESLTLWFNGTQSVDVLSLRLGYARDSRLYYANNRPRTIRFEFSDGSSADYLFGDVNQEQIIQLSRTVDTSCVKMTILDVYAGDVNDTCIYLVKAYCA